MKIRRSWISFLAAGIFTVLFYKQGAGINQSILGIMAVLLMRFVNPAKPGFLLNTVMAFVIILSISVGWHGEIWSRTILLGLVWFMAGVAALPKSPWVSFAFEHTITLPVTAQGAFFSNGPGLRTGRRKTRFGDSLLIYMIPVVLIILFIIFYSRSNPVFDTYLQKILDQLGHLTDYLKIGAIFTFILGLIIMNMFVFRTPLQTSLEKSDKIPYSLERKTRVKRLRTFGLGQALRHEHKAGIFLMFSLNILLLLLNIADIRVVWTGFEWTGQLLKSFVHEGTWYLIISIIISVVVIIYFFRGNLNFYKNSKLLRNLAYVWIIQNAFLALSVALRNYHYVENYGLAYKRIGVFFFLAAIFYGLFLVGLKIRKTETVKWWFNKILITAIITLASSAIFDWSSIITSYNLSHYKKSFVHLEYLVKMPDHTLPILNSYRDKLDEIRVIQSKRGFNYSDTLDDVPFINLLDNRIRKFTENYPGYSWQEWSYSESKAYRELKGIKTEN